MEENSIILSPENEDIYHLFTKCKWQIGVFSTSLYEGLSFDIVTFILKVKGYEYMERLFNQKLAYLIQKPEEVLSLIKINNLKSKSIIKETKKQNIKNLISITSL